MLSKKSKTGKSLASVGFIIFIFGIMFNNSIGLLDTPELYASYSLVLVVVGAILLIISNFFKKNNGSKA